MRKQFFAFGVCALAVAAIACADEVDMGDLKPDSQAPSFTPDSGGGGTPTPACVGTECPEGFATCLSGWVGAASYKCGTDLMRDNQNCGACGNECVLYAPTHMSSRCVDGACELQCFTPEDKLDVEDWRNCNQKIDDGCESNVLTDVKHCGVCGNACADGTPCIAGKCGCPAGKIPCNGYCVDPMNDDSNCGRCNNSCLDAVIPDRCEPPPNRAMHGCVEGVCGPLKCISSSADCNNDMPRLKCASDGCEVEDITTDPKNCGKCGNVCAPGEECVKDATGSYCGIPCAKYKLTLCGVECVDLLNDVGSCGACGNVCAHPGPNQARSCQKGVCVYECVEGFADCNGDPSDGCEVNLRAHPENCGACGNLCNIAAGQPCVEGKCLMVDCTAPGAR